MDTIGAQPPYCQMPQHAHDVMLARADLQLLQVSAIALFYRGMWAMHGPLHCVGIHGGSFDDHMQIYICI